MVTRHKMHIQVAVLHYAIKACTKVGGSLEAKHLCIKFESLCARVIIWFICISNFKWLSTVTPSGRIIRKFSGGLMANAERKPIMEVWGRA